jgi:hypothetical protein
MAVEKADDWRMEESRERNNESSPYICFAFTFLSHLLFCWITALASLKAQSLCLILMPLLGPLDPKKMLDSCREPDSMMIFQISTSTRCA